MVIGAAIVALDIFASPMLATFFDADAAQELEEVYTSKAVGYVEKNNFN